MKSLQFLLLFTLATLSLYGQSLYFPPNFSLDWETVEPSTQGWCDEGIEDMNEFLESTNTKAFIILKDGKIAMESYFDEHEIDTPWYWASAGKTVTAMLTGIAQENGLLDIDDPVSDYLGEGWTSCSQEQESLIAIKHQLTMTAGLDYTIDANSTAPEDLFCLNDPATEWYYHNSPYTLISEVISTASNQTYTQYTNEVLASKLGYLGAWIPNGENVVYYSTARSMARFGLLMLAEGNWNDEVILEDKAYFQAMISTSQPLNESYGYLWWLNGKESYKLPSSNFVFEGSILENAPDDLYAAIGKNGQICIVVPSMNTVIVRMGDNPDASAVPLVYVRDMWDEYSKLSCISSIEPVLNLKVDVWPRLTTGVLNVRSSMNIDRLDILDRSGRIVISVGNTYSLDISTLRSGLYFVRITSGGKSQTKRILKLD